MFGKNKKKKELPGTSAAKKFTNKYMTNGMIAGAVIGIVFSNRATLYGLFLGMCIGILIGSAKDKKLEANMMTVGAIETADGDIQVTAYDRTEAAHVYRVTPKQMNTEKFALSDRVAEHKGTLISLEMK